MLQSLDFDAYRALIFDCDGTLAINADLHRDALVEAFSALGHEMPEAFYRARTGLSLEHLLDEFAEVCGERIPSAEVLPAAAACYCRNVGQIREAVEVTAVARTYAGVKPLAVASSGARVLVLATLDQLRIAGCFDAVVSVEDVKAPKPAPDPFLLAAQRLGVEPEACLVFEDSDQGLEAARRAGMHAIDVREGAWRIR